MTFSMTRRFFLGSVAASGLMAAAPAFAAEEADIIYSGGPIITIDDANPRVEAIAVKGGRIMAAGAAADVMKLKGASTKLVDLAGRTMLPGFIDAHGHIVMGGMQALSANLLPPPDGPNADIATLQKTLRDWAAANMAAVKQINLIVGFGYDQAQLTELRHPDRDDLDAVSAEFPIIVIHQSGHLGALNSKALEIAGLTSASEDPVGGVIQRKAGSREPNGVVEESALIMAAPRLLANVGPEGFKMFAEAGANLWASFGFTTAQEGRATPGIGKMLAEVAAEGRFKVDVAAYPDALVDRDYIKNSYSATYTNRYRVAGAKLSLDGSPQGFTAWRDRPYYDPVGSYPPGYVGYPAGPAEKFIGTIDWAYENGIQTMSHANGEAASDLLIAAHKAAAAKHGMKDRRHILIHGQFQREDQVDDYVKLGIIGSLFPMHTFYWGDWHREHTVGPVLAENISPMQWYLQRGGIVTSHHDAPVALPDTMRILDATVTRRTRSGDILGPHQRVPVDLALKIMTLWSAYQHFEEKEKGSIEVGKLADLVILTDDPTAVDPETIDQIKIAETIKEGVSIYVAPPEKLRKAGSESLDQHPMAKFMTAMAADRDVQRLPEKRRTPLTRRILAAGPHNPACVNAVMSDVFDAALNG